MSYLLDTCVLSEMIKKNPDQNVINWFQSNDETDYFISVLTIGEIVKGIEKLSDSRRKEELNSWLGNDVLESFGNRIIDIDIKTAVKWGSILSKTEKTGKTTPAIDALIAASAVTNNLLLVTRNTKDMPQGDVTIIDPWNY